VVTELNKEVMWASRGLTASQRRAYGGGLYRQGIEVSPVIKGIINMDLHKSNNYKLRLIVPNKYTLRQRVSNKYKLRQII
jgi:hypothetical protein